MIIEITIKEDNTENNKITDHLMYSSIINDIITFGIRYPKDFHLLQYYSQTGGDTLQEYFNRYCDNCKIDRIIVSEEYPLVD